MWVNASKRIVYDGWNTTLWFEHCYFSDTKILNLCQCVAVDSIGLLGIFTIPIKQVISVIIILIRIIKQVLYVEDHQAPSTSNLCTIGRR